MGLDMNLNKIHKGSIVKSEAQEAIYWRKANQIHKWFVDNVQDGKDDCEEYQVSIAQLHKLLDTVKKVLADRKLAKKLLPTASGFFFGGTDYDDYYFEDLEHTKTELEKMFAAGDIEDYNYFYSASW